MTDKTTASWIRNASDERAVENGCWFDVWCAMYPIWWIERYCRLYEGEWAGEPMRLRSCGECEDAWPFPAGEEFDDDRDMMFARAEKHAQCVASGHFIDWQFECIARMFGWQKDSERWGRAIRRFRQSSIWVPKKNKKSPSLSAIGLYLAMGDGEPGQKVFFGAKDGKQAKDIAGKHASEMVTASPELSEVSTINKVLTRITHEPTRSIIEPMSSSNARTQESKEGINGCILIDETHVVDRKFINRVKRAGISRSEPFHIEVSTAGNNPDGYGKERFDYANDVQSGRQVNEQLFVAIYAAPQDLSDAELAKDPVKYGKMANAAWGHTIGKDEYLNDYNESTRSISEMAEFKMYRLNIWQQTANPWLRTSDWAKCKEEFTENDLRGRRCIAGLDLSKTRDMSSLVLLFPEWGNGGLESVRVLPYFWLPEVYARENQDKASFMQWEHDGHLILTPGEVIDYGWIRSKVNELHDMFDIVEIGYDEKYAEELTQMIEQGAVASDGTVLDAGLGIPRCVVSQGWATTAGPTAELERMVIAGTFRHNGHPVLAWQAGHATYKQDHNGNKKIVKANGKDDIKKIDGIAASITGLARVLDPDNRFPFVSIYETPGSLAL